MGWDAIAFLAKESSYDKSDFEAISSEIIKKTGAVDGGFCSGYLDCSLCGKMIELASGLSVYDHVCWDADYVKNVNAMATWDFKYRKSEEWAYLSAKLFIELASKHNLSIQFVF